MANKRQKFGFAKLDTNENLLGLKPWSGTLPPLLMVSKVVNHAQIRFHRPQGWLEKKTRGIHHAGSVCTWGKTRGIHHARICVHMGKNTRHTSSTELCARGEKHAAYITHGAVCTWGKTCHTLYKPVDSAHTVNMSRKTQF